MGRGTPELVRGAGRRGILDILGPSWLLASQIDPYVIEGGGTMQVSFVHESQVV